MSSFATDILVWGKIRDRFQKMRNFLSSMLVRDENDETRPARQTLCLRCELAFQRHLKTTSIRCNVSLSNMALWTQTITGTLARSASYFAGFEPTSAPFCRSSLLRNPRVVSSDCLRSWIGPPDAHAHETSRRALDAHVKCPGGRSSNVWISRTTRSRMHLHQLLCDW